MSFKEYPKKNLNVYFVSFASTLDPGHTIVEKFVPIVAEIKGLISPVFETDNEFGDLFRKFTVMFCPKYLYLP